MKTIFKYDLMVRDTFQVQMPSGAEILMIGEQQGNPRMWAAVHPENEPKLRTFHCHGTGHKIPEDGREHVGSCQIGSYVWHFYEAPK